jgi:hypothetical protein
VELDKKIKISRTKLEETRGRLRGADDVSEMRAQTKAVKAVEHRLDIVMGRLNQLVRAVAHRSSRPLITRHNPLPSPPRARQNKVNETHRATVESLRRDKLQRQRILKRLVCPTRRGCGGGGGGGGGRGGGAGGRW